MFYASTMRELYREFAAARLRLQDEENARITQAWQAVRIYAKAMRDKKLPKLASLWIKLDGKGGQQSPAEMRGALAVIRAQFSDLKKKETGDTHRGK